MLLIPAHVKPLKRSVMQTVDRCPLSYYMNNLPVFLRGRTQPITCLRITLVFLVLSSHTNSPHVLLHLVHKSPPFFQTSCLPAYQPPPGPSTDALTRSPLHMPEPSQSGLPPSFLKPSPSFRSQREAGCFSLGHLQLYLLYFPPFHCL